MQRYMGMFHQVGGKMADARTKEQVAAGRVVAVQLKQRQLARLPDLWALRKGSRLTEASAKEYYRKLLLAHDCIEAHKVQHGK